MQISTTSTTIKDDVRKQIYLQILSDQFCVGIISSIIDNPKTAVEIAKATNIPISTVYRRLQFLQENKMLKISGGLNKDGKYFVYLSKLKQSQPSLMVQICGFQLHQTLISQLTNKY
uniref:Uncharacterized protein n=1 Tax=uncultured marine thaumarchaeote KM3_97_B07 TaxID=1456350 RepID=A0A075HXH1_9ARCH|nr:hypothetical protein [uncultured marine thaumarchaeote KM3_97_B07]